MPGIKYKKDLYLAKNIGELNKQAGLATTNAVNALKSVKSADKLLKEADLCQKNGDEEKAYVMFMRYFNLITIVKKLPEYKKNKTYYDSLIGMKNLNTAIEQAENLSKSLKDRYDLIEAKAVSKKLAMQEQEEENYKEIENDTTNEIPNLLDDQKTVETSVNESKFEKPGVISSGELFSLLVDSLTQIIIMDVRPIKDFQLSKLDRLCCINIPHEILLAGKTVVYIEKLIPKESIKLWNQRGTVDYIILMDWNSTPEDVEIGTPLKTLKDALYKFDSSVILKNEPLILDGGYEQWLLSYPTTTTNPHISRHSPSEIILETPSLDFDYPDLESVLKPTNPENLTDAKSSEREAENQEQVLNGDIRGQMPSSIPKVDRLLKPKTSTRSLKKQTSAVNGDDGEKIDPRRAEDKSSVLFTEPGLSVNRPRVGGMNQIQTKGGVKNSFAAAHSTQKEKASLQDDVKDDFLEKKLEEEQKWVGMKKLREQEEKKVAELLRVKRKLHEDIEKSLQNEGSKMDKIQKKEVIENDKKEAEMKALVEQAEKLRQLKEKEIKNENTKEKISTQPKLNVPPRPNKEVKPPGEVQTKPTAIVKPKEDPEIVNKQKLPEERCQQELEWEKGSNLVEKQKKAEEEDKIHQKDIVEKEQQEKIRKDNEDKLKRDKEAEKLQAQKALREAEEKLRRIHESRGKPKLFPSPTLPEGWQKQLDPKTNLFYYINHNTGTTQWNAPPIPSQVKIKSETGNKRKIFKTKLLDESHEFGTSLKRSHSSPNIAQLVEDEVKLKPRPKVDRSTKPMSRFETHHPLHSKPTPNQVRVRNLNPIHGNVSQALTGLRNLGNTCYMNSTIQCLNNTAPLIKYFQNDSYLYDVNRESVLGDQGEVVDEFAVIVKALWSGQYKCITPRDFKLTVGKYAPMFAGYDQQDSQEFLTFLLDQLHEGLNKVRRRPLVPEQDNKDIPDFIAAEKAWENYKLLNQSIIVQLFQGQLKSTLRCLTCNEKSVTFQTFQYLSLPIPYSARCSLQDCLELFLKEEKMTGDCQWKCSRCKRQRDAVKKMDIWKLPHILLIGLSRFSHEGVWRHKLNTNIDFPVDNLELGNHVCGPKPKLSYQLYAVSNHYGTMEGGHYTAFCKNPLIKKWYKFDDHELYEMSKSEVKTSAAFVLFYTSIELS